jgi:hypothetical protein
MANELHTAGVRLVSALADVIDGYNQLPQATRDAIEQIVRDRDDALRYIAELDAEDEPEPRKLTYVAAGGQRIAHSGHHDDAEAIEMARRYWQLAIEDGEIGAACLAAVDAGQVVVTRETQEPITEDEPDDEAPDGP